MATLQINDVNFEPSKKAKRCWLYVRKGKRAGELRLPGLFQITSLPGDVFMLALALVLETWGLYMLVSVGGIPFSYQLAVVVAAIVLDLLFAVLYHILAGSICELSNRKVVVPLLKPEKQKAELAKLERDISRRKRFRYVWGGAIVMLACIKIYLYAALQGAFSTLVVSVLVSYAVVACIHLFFTGYAVYGLRAKFWFWWDWNEYLNGKGHRVEWFRRHEIVLWRGQDGKEVAEPNSARRIVAVQQANDADAPERSGQLSIELEAVNNKPHHVLYTWGVLTDELLDSLLNMQETSRREAVAVNGVNHQLIILDEDPVKPVRSGGDKEEEHNDAR